MHRLSRLQGFHILATDGEIGHVDDFLVDADTAQIRYLVVDTSNWIGGKWVAISLRSVIAIDWADKVIRVGLTRALVKESPALEETNVPPNELTPFTII
jgi:sporulation protein YlmC with PRC-barrel domain